MRRINLILATIIGIAGMVVYFVSIPTVNENELINLQVQSGDEQVLEDIYFTGYMDNYSGFYLDQDEIKTTGNLSYLETLDAPYNMELFKLQEEYSDLVDPIYYNRGIYMYSFLNGEDYLISSHMKENEHNYYINSEHVYLNILNKETGEIEEEIITREKISEGDRIEIVGMYEDYPTVKILYLTSFWNNSAPLEESVVSFGEYNVETKSYFEEKLLNGEGAFYPYDGETQIFGNHDQQLFTHYGTHSEDDSVDYAMYLLDYTKNELLPFNKDGKEFTIGDDGKLYALELAEGMTLLTQYDDIDEEVTHEVALEQTISQNLSDERTSVLIEVIDNKLFVVQNTINFDTEALEIQPSELQVFDIETGERLLNAKIHYDENNEVNAWSANIVNIGQRTDDK